MYDRFKGKIWPAWANQPRTCAGNRLGTSQHYSRHFDHNGQSEII